MNIHQGDSSSEIMALSPVQRITKIGTRLIVTFALLGFVLGFGSGYIILSFNKTIQSSHEENTTTEASAEISINLPTSYELGVSFHDLGPQLITTGAIDYDLFSSVYDNVEQPLTPAQKKILLEGNFDDPIVINEANAYFLLNFFWAVGLVNQNPLLEEGPMAQYTEGEIGNFASVGGWTIGTVPATQLYSSQPLIVLTSEQQDRLEEAAYAIYRPCCDNPTAFPDCNHGMAMLGLLELMASEDATVDEMLTAAKYINAFWFPRQTYEVALTFKSDQNLDFVAINAVELVGVNYFSLSGSRKVHEQLLASGLLNQSSGNGSSCGV